MSLKSTRGVLRPADRAALVTDSMPTIQFTNLEDLIRAIDAAPGDALRVTNVSPTVYKELDEGYERNKIHLSMYTEDSQCLIITIPTLQHEAVFGLLTTGLNIAVALMGLANNWKYRGTTTIYSRRSSGGGGGGQQPDASASPRADGRIYRYPTIIFEGGYSSTLPEMRVKARRYFEMSEHQVKIVILSKLIPTERRIIIERWEERQRGERRPGPATRWGSEIVPGCQQVITINENGANPPVYQVDSDDLVLSFRLLFQRDPRQGEGDVVFSVAWLRDYAVQVWEDWDQDDEAI
ncbi:hypothetical protein THAR02_06494 [Trichoderma harzianum]|uniref:Uncharacterized protein n=1 Tax=Trichoderma harzianum TaxID=5544 RepID=A0A0F9X887_TRIHA|nr:hypothetical protein THAR02_06494 [Trichoderma harzianum]